MMSLSGSIVDVRSLPSCEVRVIDENGGLFPVITAETRGMRVWVVLRGGAGHLGRAGRLDLVTSEDGGQSWSHPRVLVESESDDRNPALGITPSGVLVLAYQKVDCYDGNGKWQYNEGKIDTLLTRSHDGGESWEEPYPLNLPHLRGRQCFGRILCLPDGSLLMSIARSSGTCGDLVLPQNTFVTYLLRSRDEGLTWEVAATVDCGNADETAVSVLKNGDWLVAWRDNSEGKVLTALSTDEGQSWNHISAATDDGEHPGDLVELSDGRILLTFGRRKAPFGVQGLISLDGGRSWERQVRLMYADDCPEWDCGYPSSVLLGDGSLITVYYSGEGHIDPYRLEGSRAIAVVCKEEELIDAVSSP